MDDWAFDLEDTLLAGFQEHLLMLSDIAGLNDAVAWKLKEIKRNPRMAGAVCTVDGDVVYLAKTGRYRSGVPPLVIAYLLDVRRRIIRPFLLCKAAEVGLDGADSEDAAAEPVEERIRRALRQRNRPRGH
jgi:hypothetical protein